MFLAACGEPPPPPPPPLTVVAPPPDAAVRDVLTDPPTFGRECRDDQDCPADGAARYCFCRPNQTGGERATGFCWTGAVVKDGRWWCTVEEGVAVELGAVFF